MAKSPKKPSGSSPKAAPAKPKAAAAKKKAAPAKAKAAGARDRSRSLTRGATNEALAGPVWACPDDGTQDLENRVLRFLQEQARWCQLGEVRNGVDPSIPEARYIAILKLTLPGRGCSTFATSGGVEFYAALIRTD